MSLPRAAALTVLLLTCAGLAVPAAAGASTPTSTSTSTSTATSIAPLSIQDETFVKATAQVNLAEIAMAEIALQRSNSPRVHDVATVITSDHKTAEMQLSGVARSVGMTLPSKPAPKQLELAGELQSVPADSFDVTYLQMQINGHQSAIAATKVEIATGSDSIVTDYARGFLPVIQKHLHMATHALLGVAGVEATAPATNARPAPSHVVTTGPEAFGAKSSGSDDAGWLIGLAVVAALAILGVLLWIRHSAGSNEHI